MDDKEQLQIKIEEARARLPQDTRDAIDSVDWRNVVLSMRDKKHFTFTQLEELEVATESLLSGLLAPEQFPKELERKMGISSELSNSIVAELNESVFKKIRIELETKLADRKSIPKTYSLNTENPETPSISREESSVLESAGLKIDEEKDTPPQKAVAEEVVAVRKEQSIEQVLEKSKDTTPSAPTKPVTPTISIGKLANSFQIKSKSTDYSEQQKPDTKPMAERTIPKIDPYREMPE